MTYNFANRLEKALENRNLKPVDLANATGLSQALISQYLNNKTVAKNDKISIIAKYLNVSESWLAGFTDEIGHYNIETENTYGDHSANLEYFSNKPELLEMYKDIYENETLQLLFDKTHDLEPGDLEAVLQHIQLIRKARGLE